ncbi:hypothetical protein N7456_010949 [Penicillium angulare]|uniref:non-specific serine/threonine protein kinase n=1 Tax=Penicillium angulare TaxID=116970 RepID=A0A9W9ESS0_9EURO|nr:hypothetical protein N7456_010949 [Penicillium angulare]
MSISRPPTPPSGPITNEIWRFNPIRSLCEWVENYRPGGYHPVALGDIFNDGQYSYSQTWRGLFFHCLARPRLEVNTHIPIFGCTARDERYVALKILVSGISESTNELRILNHINEVTPTESSRHITRLLGEFEHHGPNGAHKCLVFKPMGPSVNSMLEELPQFKRRKWGMKFRYPIWMAKSILKQSLQGLDFLHKNSICHGDFQPGNILFTLNDIDSTPEHNLSQKEDEEAGSISAPVERLDRKQDKWAPKYLCIRQPLSPFTYYHQGFKVKLSDMGGAYFFTNPPEKPVTPLGLRAPELILTSAINETLDVWSFGCLVFELITGQPLFCVPGGEFQDDDHLLSLTEHLGPLPEDLYSNWKTSSLYFTPDRKVFNWEVGGVRPGEEPLILEELSMEDLFDEAEPDLDEKESLQVQALIRWILQYDPLKRPSPAEILRDPWFCNIDVAGYLSKVDTGPVKDEPLASS